MASGTASEMPTAPVGFGCAATKPPSQAQAPAAIVAAALLQTRRAISSAVLTRDGAIDSVVSQGNGAFHDRQVFALFFLHHAFQCGFCLVTGAGHYDFVVLPG